MLTTKQLSKELRGYPKEETYILIQMYDEWGNPKTVNCTVDRIIDDEQGGRFFTAVVLEPTLDDMIEPTLDDIRESSLSDIDY
jgi:hypothetical protein